MKKNFRYDRTKNEWVHKSLPISIDNDLFNEMTDSELESYIDSRLNEINSEINTIPSVKREEKPLTDEELASRFAELRRQLSMESFKSFFMKKDRLNR
jgi:hypothetical protein